ncbi:FAD-binding oxidoreductase [Flexivirga oryzae]|uniref:FAD/FMN-containing dehydrogenase n=1 Tax=Flexivirga oryzae TaxID=1794944 RepID=A0A839N1R6_9MICO|nr:FAD-binding protein [Flexivirga oryzae]MBB2890739.1 FAD/FMN-containing dehydrogenase [Flexivirga oryzae]
MVFNPTTLPDSLRPGDEGYDEASRVLFATGRPAVVMRPETRGEVADAVLHARRAGMPLAVRGGGHGLLGHGTADGGLVLDLARLDHVVVLDKGRRIVRVGGGATWGRVDRVLRPLGWAISSGDTAGVGVGGLTLGGGFGWMVRRHGLAIDNLVAARVVLADGSMVTASAARHPELFWALRGGGGNFGVVVDFDFRAAVVPSAHFGEIVYGATDPATVLRGWRHAMRRAPVELTSAVVLPPTGMQDAPSATVMLCVTGCGETQADSVIDPLLGLGEVTRATIEERSYGDILEPGGPLPAGLRLFARNMLVRRLDASVLAAVDQFRRRSAMSSVIIRSLGGRFGRIPSAATAFPHRDAEAMVLAMAMVPESAAGAEAEFDAAWAGLAAHRHGVYLNFQGRARADDLAAAYPPATYARLVEVKRRYDPDNVFRHNHNIAPEDVRRAQ